jgi:hypothetical protein
MCMLLLQIQYGYQILTSSRIQLAARMPIGGIK